MNKALLMAVCFYFISFANSGYIIITGGGKTVQAGNDALVTYKNSNCISFFKQDKFPALMKSDTVEGLNPGFFISVAAIIEKKEIANLALTFVRSKISDAYIRKITVPQNITSSIKFLHNNQQRKILEKLKEKIIHENDKEIKSCTKIKFEPSECAGGICDDEIYLNNGICVRYFDYWGGDHGENIKNYYFKNNKLILFTEFSSVANYKDGNMIGEVEDFNEDLTVTFFFNGIPVVIIKPDGNILFSGEQNFTNRVNDINYYLKEINNNIADAKGNKK